MSVEQVYPLVLGATLTLIVGVILWLLKDRIMIFGNMIYWSPGFEGSYKLPKEEGEIWSSVVTYQTLVLQVRAMGDRVANTRIQFPSEEKLPQISIDPKVPFNFEKDRAGEMHIPHLQSGTYLISYGTFSTVALNVAPSSVFADNARTVRVISPKIAPLDSRERQLLFAGICFLALIAAYSFGYISGA